ncbi:MAG TPA: alpha/beta fold hydrolase [Rhodanobacteraceae bacterium]|nr:alpha/beta fold hydrolase [Rhodanobacteraceae bacterium]
MVDALSSNLRLAPPETSLAIESRGPSDAPALLFVHGFGQTRHAWRRSAEKLAEAGFRTLTFDLRGHGDSSRTADGHYELQQFLDDLLDVSRSLPEPPMLIGASMGGLLGLALAGETTPPPFRALVLVDITPRWESAGVARMLGFMRAHPDGFADYSEAIAAIAKYLPHRTRAKRQHELEPLLRRGADGRLRWHWDPALLDTIAHEGERHQPRLLAAAREIDVPVLLLSGGRSDVVSRETIAEFMQLLPHARHSEIPQATHMLAGDDNDAFTAAIEEFISSLPDDSTTRKASCT